MNNQKNLPINDALSEQSEQGQPSQLESMETKKKFVEPALSVPVDVLEATTFFGETTVTGGGTL